MAFALTLADPVLRQSPVFQPGVNDRDADGTGCQGFQSWIVGVHFWTIPVVKENGNLFPCSAGILDVWSGITAAATRPRTSSVTWHPSQGGLSYFGRPAYQSNAVETSPEYASGDKTCTDLCKWVLSAPGRRSPDVAAQGLNFQVAIGGRI